MASGECNAPYALAAYNECGAFSASPACGASVTVMALRAADSSGASYALCGCGARLSLRDADDGSGTKELNVADSSGVCNGMSSFYSHKT